MDMPYDSKLADLPDGRQMAPAPAFRAPRWVVATAVMTILCSLGALLCARLLFAAAGKASLLGPAAILLAALAIGFGVACLVGRQVHRTMTRRLDLLTEAYATAATGHLILGSTGAVVYANATFHRFFPWLDGLPLEALGRRLVAEETGCDDLPALCQELATKGRVQGRLAIAHPAGPTTWFSIAAHQFTATGLSLWTFEDITQTYATDREIHDESAKLADFLDHAPIGFYSVDGTGRFIFVNETLAEWLGASPADLVASGAKLGDFLTEAAPAGT